MKRALKPLMLTVALASAAGVAAPAFADGVATTQRYMPAHTTEGGPTSLYSVFRNGRYDMPSCFVADPLSRECSIKPWGN